jgi:DNA-binding transcriptional regulator YiaG
MAQRKCDITAEDIKKIKEKLSLTQKELATMLKVSVDTVNSWEQGRRNVGIKNGIVIREFCKRMRVKI